MKSAADKVDRSRQQKKILKLLGEGRERKEIVEITKLSMGTVNTYISRIHQKLGVQKSGAALVQYIRLKHPEMKLF